MAGDNRVTKREAADLMGLTTRSLERRGILDAGRGIDLSALPVAAQRKYLIEGKTNVVEMPPALDGAQMVLGLTAPAGPNLSVEDRAEMERRYGVIEPIVAPARYSMLHAQHRTKAEMIAYLAGVHKVAPRTIYLWASQFRDSGLAALAPRDRCDKGTSRVLNTAAMELLVAYATGHWTVAEMHRAYGEERSWRASKVGKRITDPVMAQKYARYIDEDGRMKADAQLPEISRETLRRWFERVPEFIRVLARKGEEGFHNTQELISYRDLEAIDPLDYVVMDHRRLDIFCLAPGERGGWQLVRPWITAAIDMRTRKWLAFVVVISPSSDSIAAVLKKVFTRWGVPKAVYWDNGKDFTCEWLEGKHTASRDVKVGDLDTTWRGVLGTLDVRVHHAIPYRARAKIIEPNFGRISKFDASLPEWCGHKPQARPERFEVLREQHEAWVAGDAPATPFQTVEQIAQIYHEAVKDLNDRDFEAGAVGMRAPKVGGGYRWMSPNECWEKLIPHVQRRLVPVDVVHLLFAKRRTLTVRHSEVTVTFAGQVYHYRPANQSALAALNGFEVEFAYDPLDLEMAAVYYERRFQGLVFCAALRRMGEDAFKEDEQARRALLRQTKKFIAAAHTAVPAVGAVERLQRRREVAPRRIEAPAPVEVPPSMAEAVEAMRAENARSMADAIEVQRIPAAEPASTADDQFDFFE